MKLSLSSTLQSSTSPFCSFITPCKDSFSVIKCQQSTAQKQSWPNLKAMAKKKRRKGLEDLSDELYDIASLNLDHAPARRQVRSAFFEFHQQLDHILFKQAPPGIRTDEWYELNLKGQEIFCKCWLPKEGDQIKGVVCFCHGYGDTCTFLFEEKPELQGLPRFIFGQSMGGAVALRTHLKQPAEWDGMILVAPMCRVAKEVMPPDPVLKVANFLSNVIPEVKFFPTKDLAELAFRNLKYRKMAYLNMISYSDRVRLKTAMEILRVTSEIESNVNKVCLPLLVIHGAGDMVTDPNVSKFLYEKASCKDKTLKLYEGGYHSILEGEPDEAIFTVFDDITNWLDARCSS
ncbi:Caffeoylshikimate esterase [Bienertia sinuspersici]